MESIQTFTTALIKHMNQVIRGKDDLLEKIIITLLCDGHLLLEDVPGTGKTTTAKALSKSLSCHFNRIQFTPDLLPSDITGLTIYNQKEEQFSFKSGPIFAHIVLADEINRATPRTQSSLLECMEEKQVTVDGKTYPLEPLFMVLATQNPIETQGTFPLPEAQLDRFFMRISLGYPSLEDECAILQGFKNHHPLETLEPIFSVEDVLAVQRNLENIRVSPALERYIAQLARATRSHNQIQMGLSLRGSMALLKASRAYAAIKGRDYVSPDDVKYLFEDITSHRLLLRGYGFSNKEESLSKILEGILQQTPIPQTLE